MKFVYSNNGSSLDEQSLRKMKNEITAAEVKRGGGTNILSDAECLELKNYPNYLKPAKHGTRNFCQSSLTDCAQHSLIYIYSLTLYWENYLFLFKMLNNSDSKMQSNQIRSEHFLVYVVG